MPDKVKELDALIDRFVADTRALYPKPNPAYKPRAEIDPIQGLVPKFCKPRSRKEPCGSRPTAERLPRHRAGRS